MKLGSTDINKMYLGSTEINKAMIGSSAIFEKTTSSSGSGSSFDLSSAAHNNVSLDISNQETSPQGLYIDQQNGMKLYTIGLSSDTIYQYDLTTVNDLSTASYASKSFTVTHDTSPTGIFLSYDLDKLYVTGNTNDSIYEYSLSTAGDISTASHVRTLLVSSYTDIPADLYFSNDGTWMVMTDTRNQRVHQFNLSTAWDISTASHNGYLDPTGTTTLSTDFIISSDLSTLVVVSPSEILYQFTMSTPGDITTASYDNVNYSVASFGNQNAGLTGSSDGTKLFYARNNSPETIYEIDL